MVGMQVQSSGLHVQGPCQSRGVVEVSEVLEMARVCWRGLVGFGICDIHEYHTLPSPTQSLQHILASSNTSDVSAALPLQQIPHPHKPETAPMHPLCPKAPHCPTRSLMVSEATHYLQTSRSPPCPLAIDPRLTLEYIATLITLPHCSEPPTRYYQTQPLNYTPVV
jgi:hypothetical protein